MSQRCSLCCIFYEISLVLTFFGTDLTFAHNSPEAGDRYSHTCSLNSHRTSPPSSTMRMRFQTRTRVRNDEDRQVERSNRSSSQIPVDLHSGWWGEELQVFPSQSTEDEKEKEYVEGVFAVALVGGSTLPESQEMETTRPRLFFLSRGFALTFLMLICIAFAAVLILLLMVLYSESLLEEQNVREHGQKLLLFPPESNYFMGSLPKFSPVCYDLVSQLPLQKELPLQPEKIEDCPAGSRWPISRTCWLRSLSPFYYPHLLESFSLPSRGSFDTRPPPLLPPTPPDTKTPTSVFTVVLLAYPARPARLFFSCPTTSSAG